MGYTVSLLSVGVKLGHTRRSMIDFIHVHKQFGSQIVLEDAAFRINPGERVGVIGPNGAGKSTVFGLISGEMQADSGEILLPKNIRLGYLHQQLNAFESDLSLRDYTLRQPDLTALSDEIHNLEQSSGGSPDEISSRLKRIGELQHEFEHRGGYDILARAEAALSGLGFKEEEFDRPFRSFSGGWQMRAELVRTLVGHPDILLLDEPSNYLDLPAVEWVQRFLRNFDGTMLLISHDRSLLRSLTDHILEVAGGRTVKYAGGYDYYVGERERRHEQELAAHRNYMQRREHLTKFIDRFRAQATKATQVQSRVKMLEKMEEVKAPPSPPDRSKLRIAPAPRGGAHPLRLHRVGFTYDGRHWIFRGVDLEIARGEKIALVGFNGMGKTTLLRVLAGVVDVSEGSRRVGHQTIIGYQSQDFAETMPPEQSVFEVVKSVSPETGDREVYALLGSFGFSGGETGKPCGVLSGGEKIRLAFARMFIRPPNVLLMDEPTTHLDIAGRETLERAVQEYNGTVCLVSHDAEFVRHTADRIIALTPPTVTSYAGGYDYYLEKSGGGILKPDTTAKPCPDIVSSGLSRHKEARIARARHREETRELRKMERELETLKAEREQIHAQLAQGGSQVNFKTLGQRLSELNDLHDMIEEQWLSKAIALDE